ncbi:hypothetical protein [Bacillus solitudinis]|uniref:hypothetical protein n=1 Tax=Bacillus solitudinis TaxID=2014074 RepID=UPI000C2315EC|nr:hypothetical protein [Bacillus solitudinis]
MNTVKIIFRNYNDMIKEIDILETQIKMTMKERENWWFGGKLFHQVPLDNAARRCDLLSERIKQMHEALDELRRGKQEIESKLKRLGGLEYKIAYKRYVEGKTHQTIATELGYSPEHIRRVSSQSKRATRMLQTH